MRKLKKKRIDRKYKNILSKYESKYKLKRI